MAMPAVLPPLTVDDLEAFPEDGNRYELLYGVLLVTPQAGFPHQIVWRRAPGSRPGCRLAPGFPAPAPSARCGGGAVRWWRERSTGRGKRGEGPRDPHPFVTLDWNTIARHRRRR